MKFKYHLKKQPELLHCGKCPFLLQPGTTVLGFCKPNPIGTPEQENVCGVFRQFKNGLDDGINPKKCGSCLELLKYFHKQLVKKTSQECHSSL